MFELQVKVVCSTTTTHKTGKIYCALQQTMSFHVGTFWALWAGDDKLWMRAGILILSLHWKHDNRVFFKMWKFFQLATKKLQ